MSSITLQRDGRILIVGRFSDVDGIPRRGVARLLPGIDSSTSLPEIRQQPIDRWGIAGETVRFEVIATGAPPLMYQWLLNGGAIPGATNAALVLENAQGQQSGDYTVVVSNEKGLTTSMPARLAFQTGPFVIGDQPKDVDTLRGRTIGFSLRAGGFLALAYQWQRNGTNISGATNADLIIYNVQPAQAGTYRAVVRGGFGSLTSLPAELNVADETMRGSVDLNFDPDAGADAPIYGVSAIVPQSDGKILIGGSFYKINSSEAPGIAQLKPSGSLDTSFNSVLQPLLEPESLVLWVGAILVQLDGKILISGGFTTTNPKLPSGIARLNPDGTLDESFNPPLRFYVPRLVGLQPDGKIFILIDANVVRLNSDGSVDPSFNATTGNYSVSSSALDKDGKVLICGNFTQNQRRPAKSHCTIE